MRHTHIYTRILARISLVGSGLVLLALPAGCSGAGVTGDCQRICGTVTGCYGAPTLVDTCTSSCLDRAGGVDAGPAATAAVRGCAECVGGQTCAGLAAGACNASCPTGSFSTPGSSSGGSSSSGGCDESMPLEAGAGQVSCESGSRDYYCKCYEDGVFTRSFTSIDFCTATAAARAAQMAKACRW